MTYTELHKRYWEVDNQAQEWILEALNPSTRKAWEIIRMLEGRKGFGNWWIGDGDETDEESNDEIFKQLVEIIENK